MIFIYLLILWILVTAVWSSNRHLRRNGLAFVLWVVLSAVVLWPATKRVVSNPAIQSFAQEVQQEWEAEFVSERVY